jgi:hypothetical protein
VDSDEDITGAVTLDFEDAAVQLVGSVYRGGLEAGRWLGTRPAAGSALSWVAVAA